jgi:hypothetical protein
MEPDSIAEPGIGSTTAVPGSGYSGKSFDTANPKYLVSNHSYPSDLMGKLTEYGNNYVIFYINVNDAAKMVENNQAATVNIDASERDKSVLSSQSISAAAAATATGALGGIAGVLAGNTAAATKGVALGAGVSGVVALEQKATGANFQRSQKRLQTAIALNVPNQLQIRYSSDYGTEDMSAFQAALGIPNAVARARESGMSSLPETGSTAAAIAAALALKTPGIGSALSGITGLAPNPMKEQIFKGVDFRMFSMEYMFAPRNEAEAQNVLAIIKAFKYHMLPEYKKGSSNFLFLYPSEFDITYFNGGKENLNIHRHTSCVLTEMNVNYTPQGMFNTFRNGMPTQIGINMTFKELAIVTKESVTRGM